MTRTFRKTVSIKTVDEEARTATGAVLVSDELDHQGDFLRSEAIKRFYNPDPDIGVMHSAFPESAAEMERLEVIDEPETIGDEEFPEGTLVATRRYTDDELFELVADGVLTGFSIGGDIDDLQQHETVPDDVRIPDAVKFGRDDGAVELVDGVINEISDVDIPAVPRATYKGADFGKSILEDVDSEDEFVEMMTEERGHDESEARRLYQYLTDVGEQKTGSAKRRDVLEQVSKPFESPQGAEFEDFEDCVETLTDGDLEREEAEAVCGSWQEESKNKIEVNGETVDLTPPEAVVNAAEAALEAKREQFPDELGDCGSGVGEDRAEVIVANDLQPEDFVGGENTAISDYLDSHSEDVQGIDQPPTDWSEETWTDGCGPVQYALWGGTATGTGLDWANETEQQLSDAMETKNMTDADDGIDDATKLQVIKSWLTGSDDASEAEALDETKATDGDEEEDDDEEDDEMEDNKSENMSDSDIQSDPPEWAKSLTEKVEQVQERVEEFEKSSDGADEDTEGESAEKTDDAPPWAQNIVDKVDDLEERVDTISKQSGRSQQLDGAQEDDNDDEVEQFKKGLIPTRGN